MLVFGLFLVVFACHEIVRNSIFFFEILGAFLIVSTVIVPVLGLVVQIGLILGSPTPILMALLRASNLKKLPF